MLQKGKSLLNPNFITISSNKNHKMTLLTANNIARSRQLLIQVLNNRAFDIHNVSINILIDGNKVDQQIIKGVSENLRVNCSFLLQNSNEIIRYLAILEQILKQNTLTRQNTIRKQDKHQSFDSFTIKIEQKILRLLALTSYVHPVLNKTIQTFFLQNRIFSAISFQKKINLQSLNILCLMQTFDYQILNLHSHNLQFESNSYENALWINIVNNLTYGHYFTQWKQKAVNINQQNVCNVRNFINHVHIIRKVTQAVIYQNILSGKDSNQSIKLEQALQIQSKDTSKIFSEMQIFLSFYSFITTDYLPESFKGKSSEIIQIWIDRTVQVNSLMGNFICKQKLGQFQYVKGPLMYALEKGITLVLNNFEQISHQLLVTMRTLSSRFQINHNQRTIHSKSGFRIVGICSFENRKKSKSLQNSTNVIPHFSQKIKTIQDVIPFTLIKNQGNRQFIYDVMEKVQKLGLTIQTRLWNRMIRLRKKVLASDFADVSQVDLMDKLWNGYITESLKDQILVEIQQLTNQIDYTRFVDFHREYKTLKIGRCELALKSIPSQNIVPTQYSLRILQRLAICQQDCINESPLLVSETGCGKTTLVQYLAETANKKLFVYNMSSGTDVTDLVGGFKPIDCRVMLKEQFYNFVDKFMNQVPGAQKNKSYINSLISYFEGDKLQVLLKSLIQSIPKIKLQLNSNDQSNLIEWDQMLRKFNNIFSNLDKIDSNLVFSFMQGNLLTALKNGDWVLIDQINLATNDVLQKIIPLVQGKSLLMYQKGDLTYINRNPGFKIIACMNPATDSGKKPLPQNLLQKFTAINLSQPSVNDIELMVTTLCPQLNASQISEIYFEIKKRKTVSLRNLSRSLSYINKNRQIYGWQRATYDGLVLGYGEKDMLVKFKCENSPKQKSGYKIINGFLVQQGPLKNQPLEVFHLTNTFSEHLKDFLRAIAGTELPVLLEGPTSAGKTSMIKYVAELAGHKCIRINNHEHTEIEEYLGNYFPDKQGKLVFREGPLVNAVRQGHWLILDQLNLAKTQILQCLNRLLDDNRQLFIPQQQKHIKPHKNFRIFATQNPSTYSGRKKLSRAFRNRFIALLFGDITVIDTMAILQARRPILADSKQLSNYIKKVLEALLNYRQRQKVFSKDGLITMRDLLKWTGRKFIDKQMFIVEGYGILAERLRTIQQKQHVFDVLSVGSKMTQKNVFQFYQRVVSQYLSSEKISDSKIYVQMNKSFKRMAALTYLGVQNSEAILLVGQTGCGKTTLAQLLSFLLKRPFYSINCHKHTEASDLLGSLRPSSDPNSVSRFEFVNGVVIEAMTNGGILLIDQINTAEDSVLQRLNQLLESNTIGVERGQGWEGLKAKQGFCIIATMNPSGDYGKKELSPALRNRFTQIWVQPITTPNLIVEAKQDILVMIQTKLSKGYQSVQVNSSIALLIYEFIQHYNCVIAEKYNLSRKRLTMRDIGWMCKFICQSQDYFTYNYKKAYYWALSILAIEGLKFMMNDQHQSILLKQMNNQLIQFIEKQCGINNHQQNQLEAIQILKNMDFPLMIKTDLPLELIGIKSDNRIFFSAHTDLSDLLGQFQPVENSFVWKDQQLLQNIRKGGRTALMDLNLAQQQVIEGVNSLFDYRGSIFVVQLNETVLKHPDFKPVVVLKYTNGNERKGLPNSFLNRFVKICVDDVSLQTKLNYLKNKYPQIQYKPKIIKVLTEILETQKLYPIQRLQLLCQVCVDAPIELGTCMQFLQVKNELKIDPHYLLITQEGNEMQLQLKHAYEQRVLCLLPLIQQFNLKSAFDIQNIRKINTIYSLSRFSACLVGDCQKRDEIAQVLAYILNKRTTKIILSTMTDMNDLLGSYEQITQQNFSQNSMEEQKHLVNAFNQKSLFKTEAKKTKFVYKESAIVKALKDDLTILYIQVPNQILLERVEKGLVEVYSQSKQIILGIDNMQLTKSNNTKFIPIKVDSQSSYRYDNLVSSLLRFPQNLSNLTHLNSSLRKKQLHDYIEQIIKDQTSRPKIVTYRRMLIENNSDQLNTMDNKDKLTDRQVKCRQKKIKEIPFKYVQTELPLENLYLDIKKNIIHFRSHDFSSFKQQMLWKSFLGMTSEQISKRSVVYGKTQQKLLSTIQKFQTLFACNIENFQQNSLRILSVIFSVKLTLSESIEMLQKFNVQIERLYEQLFRDKIREIVINFNEEQTKIIPIISNQETVKYLMKDRNLSVRLLADETPKVSLGLPQGVQRRLVHILQNFKINVKQISQWVIGMRLKDLKQYEIFQGKIKNRPSILPDYTNLYKLLNEFFTEGFPQLPVQQAPLDDSQQSTIKQKVISLAHHLLNLFRPCPSLAENVSLHIKGQLELQSLKQVISDEQTYLQCYKQICSIKYLGLEPNKYQLIKKSIQGYQTKISHLSKTIVYRGYDNVKSLIEFYQYFINMSNQIQKSDFDPHILQRLIVQSYDTFYDNFSDILLPYYLALIVIYKQGAEVFHQQSLSINILGQPEQIHPIFALMEEVVDNQNEEVDRAKDYVKFQRKFNKTVIIDQYTEEGVAKNKQNIQQDFNDLFGKNQHDESKGVSEMDQIFDLLNKETQNYYNFLCNKLNTNIDTYEQMIIALALTTTNKKITNIYEQRNTEVITELIRPLPKMMSQVYVLLGKYKIDSLKTLAGLLGKVYEHKAYKDEVYKILVDCEFIIEQSFKLNSILPSVERVPCDQIIVECLKLRRLQLKNWKTMLHYKQQRTQKSDLINLIQFYKMMKLIKNPKEAFTMADNFLRESTVCCLPSRMNFLDLIAKQLIKDISVQAAIYRVMGFYQYLMPHVNQFFIKSYDAKVLEMKEYEKLAGWSSNEYLIFKATCEKFQRKIHHILRKFDDELSMSMASLTQQIKQKQISNSVDEFQTALTKQFPSSSQDNIKSDKENIQKSIQMDQNEQKIFAECQYEQIIVQLFECLKQVSQPYQNSQSKLRIIRTSLQQLEQVIKAKKQAANSHASSLTESKYLVKQMFCSEEAYKRTAKFYYGIWDKLCQRQETSWNRDLLDRIWNVAESIWVISNSQVPQPQFKTSANQLVEDVKILFLPYLTEDKNKQVSNKYLQNPIFKQQLQTIKTFIVENVQQQTESTAKINQKTQNLLKLGYIISSIALNLQKNGFCVKDEEQNDNQSGTDEEIGDGMGIGQGEVHQAAQNIGDQIEFQEQVQGNKDEQKKQNNQNNKEQQNDIDMQGQFDGQMYSKEQNQNDGSQQQQAKSVSDEQMGEVNDQKRQQDMKNQQGQAQGQKQADIDIKGQKQGEQELVDNQREKDKEKRKGEQNRQDQQMEEQSQRSDWEDNNQQGEKINKQKQQVQQHERDSQNLQDQKQPQQISGSDGEGQSEQMSGEDDQQNQNQDSKDIDSKQNQQSNDDEQQENKSGLVQIQNSEEPMDQQKDQEQKQQDQKQKKQAKNRRQYEKTYGRKDNQFQNNNLVRDQMMDQQQNMGEGQENADGGGQGQKGAGKSVHSLREQFLQEIMKKDNKSKGNQQFHKNLDVRIQQQNDQDVDENDQVQEQQYALTEEDKKISTNLGMMDIQEKEKKEKEKEKEKQQKERNAKAQQKQKNNKEQAPTLNDKKKPSQKNSKNEELGNKNQIQQQKVKQQQKLIKQQTMQQGETKKQPTIAEKGRLKTINLIDQDQQTLIKAAISNLTNLGNSSLLFTNHSHLITQSYMLSKILQEQLKSVLEPLDQAQYKGDYKTGKKLNLKKIIPFIASNYRKDRIWLRRTQPSDRNYYIMLALDDTKSMHYGGVGQQALKGLMAIAMALQGLNIKTSVTAIRDTMVVSKGFGDLLNCQKTLEDFSFQYESSNSHDLSMSSFMANSLNEFDKVQSTESNGESRQLCIIISDGKMNKQMVKPFLKEANKKGITYVFIIIDSTKNSILSIKTVQYVNGKMEIKNYMNDFPFDYFLVINNAKQLGDILGATLMQFIQQK